ncbi:hypothetical protein [Anaerosporobacter faecicola]|nr:hypothetical protein [Anaerosporobacter faecicola]
MPNITCEIIVCASGKSEFCQNKRKKQGGYYDREYNNVSRE